MVKPKQDILMFYKTVLLQELQLLQILQNIVPMWSAHDDIKLNITANAGSVKVSIIL